MAQYKCPLCEGAGKISGYKRNKYQTKNNIVERTHDFFQRTYKKYESLQGYLVLESAYATVLYFYGKYKRL